MPRDIDDLMRRYQQTQGFLDLDPAMVAQIEAIRSRPEGRRGHVPSPDGTLSAEEEQEADVLADLEKHLNAYEAIMNGAVPDGLADGPEPVGEAAEAEMPELDLAGDVDVAPPLLQEVDPERYEEIQALAEQAREEQDHVHGAARQRQEELAQQRQQDARDARNFEHMRELSESRRSEPGAPPLHVNTWTPEGQMPAHTVQPDPHAHDVSVDRALHRNLRAGRDAVGDGLQAVGGAAANAAGRVAAPVGGGLGQAGHQLGRGAGSLALLVYPHVPESVENGLKAGVHGVKSAYKGAKGAYKGAKDAIKHKMEPSGKVRAADGAGPVDELEDEASVASAPLEDEVSVTSSEPSELESDRDDVSVHSLPTDADLEVLENTISPVRTFEQEQADRREDALAQAQEEEQSGARSEVTGSSYHPSIPGVHPTREELHEASVASGEPAPVQAHVAHEEEMVLPGQVVESPPVQPLEAHASVRPPNAADRWLDEAIAESRMAGNEAGASADAQQHMKPVQQLQQQRERSSSAPPAMNHQHHQEQQDAARRASM